jgi:hypothetical protein
VVSFLLLLDMAAAGYGSLGAEDTHSLSPLLHAACTTFELN